MEIGKINSAIEHAGYNPFGVSGTGNDDAMKLAEKNGISVEEAQEVLKEAEKKAEEEERMKAQQSAMLGVLNTQDEEELVAFDDTDFDDFLSNIDAETKMQNMLHQQQFARQDNSQMQGQNQGDNSQNVFAQSENPFTKLKF
ncbi:MAG: hypothetical protein K6A44_05415 [bacterium]|nr:hypothetical protein [bacterium]